MTRVQTRRESGNLCLTEEEGDGYGDDIATLTTVIVRAGGRSSTPRPLD